MVFIANDSFKQPMISPITDFRYCGCRTAGVVKFASAFEKGLKHVSVITVGKTPPGGGTVSEFGQSACIEDYA